MIIWLASYPKSGNTWLRSIVSSLLYSKSGNFDFELLKNIRQFPEKQFFKDIIKDESTSLLNKRSYMANFVMKGNFNEKLGFEDEFSDD